MFEDLMRHIGDAVGNWLYLIAGGVGFVLPGEIALLVAGYFCRYGTLEVWIMAIIAVVCAIVGDSVGFEFGRHFGPPVRRSRVGRFVGESRWSTVDAFLHRHGGKAI